MSQEVHIDCQPRDAGGTNAARRVRHAKMIPAVVYGGGRDPESVSVDPRPIEHVLESNTGLNTLINLKIGERELKRMVLIRQVQRHPATEVLMHCDFVRVEMDQEIEVAVPVQFNGLPEGVKNEGGVVEYVNREILIRVLPANIPPHLDVDISPLHAGQHLEAGEVPLPEGCTLMTPENETLCTVAGKMAELEVEEAAVEGEDAEAEAEGEGTEEESGTTEG